MSRPAAQVGGPALGHGAGAQIMSVLFSDVRGFTGLAEGVPASRVAELVGRHLSVMARLVASYDGRVLALTGDGLMAVFTGRVAGRSHRRRALACGLAMQATQAAMNAHPGAREVRLEIGVGVNTGVASPMVVEGLGEPGATVVGDAVNVAQRLACRAGPGEVLAATGCLAGQPGVLGEALGPMQLRGRAAATDVVRVLAVAGGGGPGDRRQACTKRRPRCSRRDEVSWSVPDVAGAGVPASR